MPAPDAVPPPARPRMITPHPALTKTALTITTSTGGNAYYSADGQGALILNEDCDRLVYLGRTPGAGEIIRVTAPAAAGDWEAAPDTTTAPGPVQAFLHDLATQLNTTHGFHWNAGDVQAELIRQMRLHGVDENAGLRKRNT